MSKKNLSNNSSCSFKLVNEIKNLEIISELLTFPDQAVIWSLINGPHKGEIFEFSGGEGVIIIEKCSDPFIFMAGKFNREDFEDIVTLCDKDPYLYCSPWYHKWFLQVGWQTHLRVQLTYNNHLILPLSAGLYVKPINNLDFFKRCFLFEEVSGKFGSPENFLKYGEGYALCNNDHILSEAYSDYCSNQYVGINIVTHPNYRKQGAAAQIASYFAEKLLEKGKIPIWSCNASNLASLKTAFKVGFQIDKYYVNIVQNQEPLGNDEAK